MKFYTGAPEPAWLERTRLPLFVSYGRLRRLKAKLPRPLWRADGWALDSRGFTELRQHGKWTFSPAAYLADVLRYGREIGGLEWAAQQDWMTENEILAATGRTVADHVRLTVAYYLVTDVLFERVRADDPDSIVWDGNPVLPVAQGATLADYLWWWKLMGDPDAATRAFVAELGGPGFPVVPVDLIQMPIIGVGSVCTRQSTQEIADIVAALYERGHNGEAGTPLHGFGVKTQGLPKYGHMLDSADSQAWSAHARHRPRHPQCPGTHAKCTYCLWYAQRWTERMLATVAGGEPAIAA